MYQGLKVTLHTAYQKILGKKLTEIGVFLSIVAFTEN